MANQGMPGAKKLYTKPPEIKPPSFIAKYLLGKTAEIKGGSPVFGYPIGTLKITGELECRRIVYLCDNNQLKVYENASGGNKTDDTEVVTDLGQRAFEIGHVYDYHDDLDEWDRNHQPDGIKCHVMPLKELLNNIAPENLNTV